MKRHKRYKRRPGRSIIIPTNPTSRLVVSVYTLVFILGTPTSTPGTPTSILITTYALIFRLITFQRFKSVFVSVELLVVSIAPIIPIISTAVVGRIILKTLAFNIQQIGTETYYLCGLA